MNMNDDKLDKAVTRLAREVQPGRDLWPGIAARLEQRRRAPRPLWAYSLAASLFLVVGAGGLWFAFGQHRAAPGAAPEYAVTTPVDPYLAQRAAYAEQSVQGATDLDPATRGVILKNLHIIEGSMQKIQAALDKDPNNPRLRALLYDLYQNESRLLAATQQIQAQTNARNDL